MGNVATGNVHVSNGSTKAIRVRVCQEEVRLKAIDVSGKVGAPFALEAKVKVELDHSLDEKGFARIGPGHSLEFDIETLRGKEEYITVGHYIYLFIGIGDLVVN